MNYATSDGTATAGTDYTSTSGTLNFADGQTSRRSRCRSSTTPRRTEAKRSTCASPLRPAAQTLGPQSTATLTISDVPGALQFSAPTYSVRKDGATATITVSRTLGDGGAVSVNYATSDGTAKAGTNYTSTSGTLNFPDGQTSETFTVPILNDPVPLGSETLNLSLSTPSRRHNAWDTIVVDARHHDTPGGRSIRRPSYSVRKDGKTATVTVTRTLGDGGAISVNYATSDGTAKAGTNYTGTSGTLNFPDGQTTETFTVPILDDPVPFGSETLNLSLSTPTGGATLGTQSSSTLTITDTPGALQFTADLQRS